MPQTHPQSADRTPSRGRGVVGDDVVGLERIGTLIDARRGVEVPVWRHQGPPLPSPHEGNRNTGTTAPKVITSDQDTPRATMTRATTGMSRGFNGWQISAAVVAAASILSIILSLSYDVLWLAGVFIALTLFMGLIFITEMG